MASRKTSTHSGRGFTLVELLVVMGLIAVIGGLSLFVSLDSFRGFSYRSERSTIIASLERARSQAMSNICLGACSDGRKHGVHFAPHQYIIFQTGSDWSGRDAALDEVVNARSNAVFVTAVSDSIFTSLSGTTTATTIVVGDGQGHSSIVSIGSEGQLSWTN